MPGFAQDGVYYPSVTEILSAVGLGWPSWVQHQERAAQLGTAVHKVIALSLTGELDQYVIHPEVQPGLNAFRAFQTAVNLVPRAVEVTLFSREWGVVGHPDVVGYFNDHGKLAIIDWKFTDSVDVDLARLQLAGYQLLWNYTQADRVDHTYVCQLRKNGTYNLIDVTDESQGQIFAGAVHVWRALKAMGRLGR